MLLELAMRQPPAQPRFAHARIADQDEFSSGVVDALLRLTKQQRFVQLPDANDSIFFSQRRQHRQTWVKGEAGGPSESLNGFLQHSNIRSSVVTPQTDVIVPGF